MKNVRRAVLLCLLVVGTTACDRATKHLAIAALAGAASQSYLADTVRLSYHENAGAFLGVGSRWRPEVRAAAFQIGNGLFLIATALLAVRYRVSRLAAAGLTLFLAGGASNLIDRVAIGSVVDFLNIGIGPVRTGIFNIADVAILGGLALLVVEGVRRSYTPAVSNSRA
jgi:signal peptidase II